MIFRLSLALVLSSLSMIPVNAHADFIDFINGRMVGKEIQPLDFQFHEKRVEVNDKVVLFDFWASWCVPCRDSIPELNKLSEEYAAQNLVVLGVTQDKTEEITSFIKKIPMNYPIATDVAGKLFKRLSVRAMPYAVLVNKKGVIIWQGDPQKLKRSQIDAALKE